MHRSKNDIENITVWKSLGKKAKGKSKKRWMYILFDDMKIMRKANSMKNTRNKEVWHILVEKAKIHKVL